MKTLYQKFAPYYDLLYSYKNYEAEVNWIISLIEKYKKAKGNLLLDMGCGTGKHLQYLKRKFSCSGIDINQEMLAIAKNILPTVEFKKANMINMRLGKKFDVITSFFTAIGYVKTYKNLQKTWETIAVHLKKGGVAIIEPWFSPDTYPEGEPFFATYAEKNIKIARAGICKIKKNLSVVNYHYMVAERGKDVVTFQDKHEFGLFGVDETLMIMQNAGFEAHHLEHKSMGKRGIFLGVKK